MKKIIMIFLILTGGYILFSTVGGFSGNDRQSVKLTDKVDNIKIDVNSATVTIIPEHRDDLKAELDGRGTVKVSQNGDTITIRHERNWFFSFPFFNSAKLKVYIPNHYQQDMLIDVGSGGISLEGESDNNPFQLKELKVNLTSGNVKLNNLSLDEFIYDGSSGTLSAHSLLTNKSSVDISSGKVKLTDFTGQLDAELSSGKLDVEVAELIDSITIDVSSGSVLLDLPDDADFSLDGDIGSGRLSYDLPLTIEKEDNHHVKGSHGTGEHKVEVDVSSGSVKIY